MKKILLFFFLCLSLNVFAQVGFKRNVNIPVDKGGALELAWAGGLNFPVFSEIDLNADNAPDLFAFDKSNNRCVTFINNGSGDLHCWVYAPQYAERFPQMYGWAYLCDYNCDNKPDLYTTNFGNNGIALYKNVSQGANLSFILVDPTIEYSGTNIFASAYLTVNIDDIDGDGDIDILGQSSLCVGAFAYYKNMSVEHYGVCDSLSDYVFVTNAWGNFATRSDTNRNVFVSHWGISCFGGPGGSSYQAERDDTYANIRTIDIDGDGDKDALIGDSQTKNCVLAINGGTPANANMVQPQDTFFPSYDTSVNLHWFTTNSYLDLDDDGIKDLVVSQSEFENNKGILVYKNLGTNAIPNFHYQVNDFLQGEMIDVGEYAAPVLFDYDGDGLNDMVIGNKYFTTVDTSYVTGLTLYKNIGSNSNPAFQFITDDYAGLHSLTLTLDAPIYPAFGDLDGDADVDMILGLNDGTLGYFENTAGPGAPAVFATPVFQYMSINVTNAITPQLFDIDQDGLLDLIMGCQNGSVKYFKNLGSANFAFYSTVATESNLGDIDVHTPLYTDGYSVPFLFKQNGDIRMFVSCMRGIVFLYGNISNNVNGTFTLLDTVITNPAGFRYAHNLTVSGGDLNNDSLVDMILGLYSGGIQIYYQDTSTTSVASLNSDDLIRVYPVPASESIVIKNALHSGKVVYTLYDLTGRMILSKTESGNYSILDVSAFSEGVYVLNISSADFSGTRKIIIERN